MSKSATIDPAALDEKARRVRLRKSRKRRRERVLAPNRAILAPGSDLGEPREIVAIALRPYQVEAKQLAMRYLGRPEGGGFCLFAEQRTGKTPMACSIVQEVKPERLLIACPVAAVGVWDKHLRDYGLYDGREIKIVNFQSIWPLRKWIRKWGPDMVIVDESHRIKKRTSKQSKVLRKIGSEAKWKLALTGTPLEGKLEDAWAQYDFIDPSVFGSWEEFKTRYLVYGGFKGKKIVGYQNQDEYVAKMKSRFFRVLLEDVKPIKTIISPPHLVRFDLVESRPAYDSMEQNFIVGLDQHVNVRIGGKFVKRRRRIVAPRVITQIMKLHQLSGGFILDNGRVHRFGDEKLEHTGELMLKLGNIPIVVIVRFIPELYRVAALVRAMGRTVQLISGDHKFTQFTADVAVVQIRSGISIDLSRAEDIIFHSWGYSYLDYDQARMRILSYTSTHARYHYLIARDTIDEDLYQVIKQKKSVVNLVINKYRRRASNDSPQD